MPMVLNFKFFVYAPGRDLSPRYTDYFIDNSYPVSVYGCVIGKTTQANANPNEYNTYL